MLQEFCFWNFFQKTRAEETGVEFMHEAWMQRALTLAEKGWGKTSPNPLVGAVIVKDGQVVSEGYHAFAGGPHAEVEALRKAGAAARGSDIYVTLEPCNHYGKTPPCTEALIASGIRRVYVALKDPNPLVSGSGITRLQEAGIEVFTGILAKEATELNEIFIHYITHKTPFVIYKAAMSLDGKTAANSGHSKWITGAAARRHVHWTRQRVSGIMVGIGTVLKDDPHLTVRGLDEPPVHPLRIVLDSQGKIPLNCQLVCDTSGARTMVATTDKMSREKEDQLRDQGIDVIRLVSEEDRVSLPALMEVLGSRNIDSILLEGGGTLAASAVEKDLVHKVMFYMAPKLIGGSQAPGVLMGKGIQWMDECVAVEGMTARPLGEDLLITGKIQQKR
jgi:diaminohydroxyphosphoribosylaminopyrimidine deaminase / 5-amino-6-(5-phosphoribosylamino)uracil reductase